MTVSYTGDVANASNFGIFVKILYKWKGSVYKLVYKELLAYILCYFVINITYRTVIVENSDACDESLPSCLRSDNTNTGSMIFNFRTFLTNGAPTFYYLYPSASCNHRKLFVLRNLRFDCRLWSDKVAGPGAVGKTILLLAYMFRLCWSIILA